MFSYNHAVREPMDVTPADGALSLDMEASRILLVGEGNPQSWRLEHTLVNYPDGCAGHRLQRDILGLVPDIYHEIWRMNLCNRDSMLASGISTRDYDKRVAAEVMRKEVMLPDAPWQLVILLGNKVREAFRSQMYLGVFESCQIERKMFVALPHPSGRCREWNDYANYGRAQKLVGQFTTLPIGGP